MVANSFSKVRTIVQCCETDSRSRFKNFSRGKLLLFFFSAQNFDSHRMVEVTETLHTTENTQILPHASDSRGTVGFDGTRRFCRRRPAAAGRAVGRRRAVVHDQGPGLQAVSIHSSQASSLYIFQDPDLPTKQRSSTVYGVSDHEQASTCRCGCLLCTSTARCGAHI